MQAKELTALPSEELEKRLDDAHRELFNLRFQREQKQLKDLNNLKRVRRNIARIMTVIRQRDLAKTIQTQAGGEA